MAHGTRRSVSGLSSITHAVLLHFCIASGGNNHEEVSGVLCNKGHQLVIDGKNHKPKRKSSLTTISLPLFIMLVLWLILVLLFFDFYTAVHIFADIFTRLQIHVFFIVSRSDSTASYGTSKMFFKV